jgi:molybdopterin converting factor small subunit
MKITLVTFAAIKDFSPTNTEIIIKERATIKEVRQELLRRTPAIAGILQASRFAVKESLVDDAAVLNEGEIVYIIPPSSGG